MYGCGVDVTVCVLKEEMGEEELVSLIGGGLEVVRRDSRGGYILDQSMSERFRVSGYRYSHYYYYWIYIITRVELEPIG